MTTIPNTSIQILNPPNYQRNYWNDLPYIQDREGHPYLDTAKHVTLAVLPLLTLSQRLAPHLLMVLGTTRLICSLERMVEAINNNDGHAILRTSANVAFATTALACFILSRPLGMMVTSAHDIAITSKVFINAIRSQNYGLAAQCTFDLATNAAYLGCFVTGSLEWTIGTLALQILSEAYHSIDEWKAGNYLEAASHLIMATARSKQCYELLSVQHLIGALPPQYQEAREREAIARDPRLQEIIGNSIYEIEKVDGGYRIITDFCTVQVDVTYLPAQDGRCGPAEFDLSFAKK